MPNRPLIFVCPRVPHPLNSGAKIRTWALLDALAGRYGVHYVGFLQPDLAEAEARAKLACCAGVTLAPEPAVGLAGKGWLAARSLADARPATMMKYQSARLAEAVRRLVAAHPAAPVHADHLHMACYLPGKGHGGVRAIDEHNVEAQIVERAAETFRPSGLAARLAAPAIGPWMRGQARRMRRHEALALGRADLTLAVSPGDAGQLAAMAPGRRVEVIPNGVDLDFFRPAPEGTGRVGRRLVFTGSMNWLPNQDGTVWFCREIMPLLGGEGWSLDIVGQAPPPAVRELACERVRVTGMVDDVRPYAWEAETFIVPLRIGGGSRLKILEAFAMGVPVVSTAVGCEGLGVTDGRELLVADTPREFAAAIERLEREGGLRERLVAGAARHVREHFSWKAIGGRLLEIYAEYDHQAAP